MTGLGTVVIGLALMVGIVLLWQDARTGTSGDTAAAPGAVSLEELQAEDDVALALDSQDRGVVADPFPSTTRSAYRRETFVGRRPRPGAYTRQRARAALWLSAGGSTEEAEQQEGQAHPG